MQEPVWASETHLPYDHPISGHSVRMADHLPVNITHTSRLTKGWGSTANLCHHFWKEDWQWRQCVCVCVCVCARTCVRRGGLVHVNINPGKQDWQLMQDTVNFRTKEITRQRD